MIWQGPWPGQETSQSTKSISIALAGRLVKRYADVPMSLADACLVRMAEQHVQSKVLTLDQDFRIYRKHSRQVIPVLMPH